jgi:hypothetical protein
VELIYLPKLSRNTKDGETATVGMFDNSYFDNSKSQKTDYVRQLEDLVFEKKIFLLYRERETERETERERERERERDRQRPNLT